MRGEGGIFLKGSLTLTFITSNQGKYKEAREIFKNYGIKVMRIPQDYSEVQADTLEEVIINALQNITKKNAFIEDSGLFIHELKGFPGVYSSYVLKTLGNEGILKLMKGIKNRKAEFRSVVGYIDGKKKLKMFEGKIEGNISNEMKGKKGFGYDPIFIPEGYKKTFADDIIIKNKISHRKKALERLAIYLRGKNNA